MTDPIHPASGDLEAARKAVKFALRGYLPGGASINETADAILAALHPTDPPATAAGVGEADLADALLAMFKRRDMKVALDVTEVEAIRAAAQIPASHEALIARVRELEAGLDEIGVWYAEAPHTFPDWKTAAEAMAQMAENVRAGHPALFTPESRALLADLDAGAGR